MRRLIPIIAAALLAGCGTLRKTVDFLAPYAPAAGRAAGVPVTDEEIDAVRTVADILDDAYADGELDPAKLINKIISDPETVKQLEDALDAFRDMDRRQASDGVVPVPAPVTIRDDRSLWRTASIWDGPSSTYKLVGLDSTPWGWVATAANVYHGGNRSAIYLGDLAGDVRQVYRSSEETIGQPVAYDGAWYFPVEHGSNVLRLSGDTVTPAGRTYGRWSTAAGLVNGRPALAWNDRLSKGRFLDACVVRDAESGSAIWKTGIKAMITSIANFDGATWASFGFGRNVTASTDGRVIDGDVVPLAPFLDALYAGGGARWGRNAGQSTANGRVYVLRGDAWVEVADTGSSAIMAMRTIGWRLWIAGIDPDQLLYLDTEGAMHLVARIDGESASDHARGFGAGIAEHEGTILWGRSDKTRPHVYTVVPAEDRP